MRGKFYTIVNKTWYSILFDHKLTKLFSIENFSGAKHAGKVLIIIIILFLIIILHCSYLNQNPSWSSIRVVDSLVYGLVPEIDTDQWLTKVDVFFWLILKRHLCLSVSSPENWGADYLRRVEEDYMRRVED